MDKHYWLLLEKSDVTRVSKGIDGYQDITGASYHYDSFVPNFKRLNSGDLVVLRKENDILGVGTVHHISKTPDTKIQRRCPECSSTDIRERITKIPKWKCGKCACEFDDPNETIAEVQSFVASIEDFARINAPPSVIEVKQCAAKGDGVSSQNSIMELDQVKIKTLLEGLTQSPSSRTRSAGKSGQGFGLSPNEKKQVELRAMFVARQLYEMKGWNVIDTSASHPYDFLASCNGQKRFIEVKGTTGEGKSIVLTHGEVEHARQHRSFSVLVIVSGIVLTKSDSHWIASSGEVTTHEDPWIIDDAELAATQYRYSIKKQEIQ